MVCIVEDKVVELVGGGSVPAVCAAGLFKHNFKQKQHPLKVWIEFLKILNFGDPLPLVIKCPQRNNIKKEQYPLIFKFFLSGDYCPCCWSIPYKAGNSAVLC